MPDDPAREEWQVAEIEAGLAEADRGEFATADDLSDVIAKYDRTDDANAFNHRARAPTTQTD